MIDVCSLWHNIRNKRMAIIIIIYFIIDYHNQQWCIHLRKKNRRYRVAESNIIRYIRGTVLMLMVRGLAPTKRLSCAITIQILNLIFSRVLFFRFSFLFSVLEREQKANRCENKWNRKSRAQIVCTLQNFSALMCVRVCIWLQYAGSASRKSFSYFFIFHLFACHVYISYNSNLRMICHYERKITFHISFSPPPSLFLKTYKSFD